MVERGEVELGGVAGVLNHYDVILGEWRVVQEVFEVFRLEVQFLQSLV